MKFYKQNDIVFGWHQPLDFNEIHANTTDGALEKHVPVYTLKDRTVEVNVGSINHPMTEAHYIEWILIETTNGHQVAHLTPDKAPQASFVLSENEQLINVYAYCNLHGLWKA